MTNPAQRAHASYFNKAFEQHMLVADAKAALERYADQYDVLVGTGMSGAMVVPLLAFHLGKRFIIVRKPDDINNHSGRKFEGMIAEGDRMLFVDDFISSGRTIMRTLEILVEAARRWKPKYVGRYEYQGQGVLTWEDSDRWGVNMDYAPQMPAPTFKPAEDEVRAPGPITASDVMRMQSDYLARNYPYKSLERKLPTFDFDTFKSLLNIDWAETEKRVVMDPKRYAKE